LQGVGLGRLGRRQSCSSLESWAASVVGVFVVLGGGSPVRFWCLWCIGRRRSWASLAASVLFVFGVLDGVDLVRLWRLGQRRSCSSLASWTASVLFVFGGVGGRLGGRRSWASWTASALFVFGVYGGVGPVRFWRLGGVGLGRLERRRYWASLVLYVERLGRL
jgi:hypothetical protein